MKKPIIIKLRCKDTAVKRPQEFKPDKGKGSYDRKKKDIENDKES
jgi:stalled ribosome alternative rescue factor ArfA